MPCREELKKFVLFKTSCFSQDLVVSLEVLFSFLEGRKKTNLQKKPAVMSVALFGVTAQLSQMNCKG